MWKFMFYVEVSYNFHHETELVLVNSWKLNQNPVNKLFQLCIYEFQLSEGLHFWREYEENDAVTDWVWKSLIGLLYIRVHDVKEQSKFKISSKYLSRV